MLQNPRDGQGVQIRIVDRGQGVQVRIVYGGQGVLPTTSGKEIKDRFLVVQRDLNSLFRASASTKATQQFKATHPDAVKQAAGSRRGGKGAT